MSEDSDRLRRAYRAANEALDARPSAATRAAILAAAAREVKAQPRDAAARPRRGLPRWPMAAAAAVLLSTLAAMLTVRTEREMPSFNAPPVTERAPAPVAARPAAPAEKADAASASRETIPAQGSSSAQASPEVALNPAPSRDAPPLVKRAAPKIAQQADAQPGRDQTERDSMRQLRNETPATAAPEQRARSAKEESAAPSVPLAVAASPEVKARAATPETARTEPAPATASSPGPDERTDRAAGIVAKPQKQGALAASAAASAESAAADAASPPLRAEDWLDKIIRLRRDGRHAEADAELKQFRERYPQVAIPAEALPPTGTR